MPHHARISALQFHSFWKPHNTLRLCTSVEAQNTAKHYPVLPCIAFSRTLCSLCRSSGLSIDVRCAPCCIKTSALQSAVGISSTDSRAISLTNVGTWSFGTHRKDAKVYLFLAPQLRQIKLAHLYPCGGGTEFANDNRRLPFLGLIPSGPKTAEEMRGHIAIWLNQRNSYSYNQLIKIDYFMIRKIWSSIWQLN